MYRYSTVSNGPSGWQNVFQLSVRATNRGMDGWMDYTSLCIDHGPLAGGISATRRGDYPYLLIILEVPSYLQIITRRVRPRCDTNLYRPVPNLNLVQIQIEKLHLKANKQLFQKPMYTPRHLSKIYLTIYKFTRRHSDIFTYTSESERGVRFTTVT